MKLSRRVLELAESATLAVTAKAARLKAEGVDVVSFGAGEPDFDTPLAIRQAAVGALDAGQTRYPKPASGIPVARQAVCAKLMRDSHLHYVPDQVIITSGGKEAAFLAIHALIEPGDEVVIPAPYWVSYPEIVRLAGGTPVHVAGREERDFKLTSDLLRMSLTAKTRMFILNSPSNPSGVTYHPDEIRALASVLQEHDLIVFADEIYDRLIYDGQQTFSYAAAGAKAFAQTITANSASKTYAMPGWRLGYAAGPKPIIDAMAKIQSQSTSGAATFAQVAYAEALSGDQAPVEAIRVEFQRGANYMWDRLGKLPGVKCPRPSGAFYCFPNVAAAYSRLGVHGSIEFADRLLEKARVAVVPGEAFGMDAHIRLSFAVGMEQITKGLDRIEAFLKG